MILQVDVFPSDFETCFCPEEFGETVGMLAGTPFGSKQGNPDDG